jgi:hypothetical protein
MGLDDIMDIADFNRKLSVFIMDARALEKTDRKRANAMWLKICEFAIEFSKQKNVDRTLRLRIWKQVELIIQKVKGEEVPSAVTYTSNQPETKVPFEVDFGFDFPSVPEEEEEENEQKDTNVPFQNPPPPEDDNKPVDEEKALFHDAISKPPKDETKVNDFINRIKKMEEELRSMPDIFKEIKPSEYTPNKSIIPSSAPPPYVSPEQPTSPATNIEKDSSLSIEPVERPDTIDPYKGTKDTQEIKDPFGPEAEKDLVQDLSKKEIFCYACGAPVREKDTTCSKCGAEL